MGLKPQADTDPGCTVKLVYPVAGNAVSKSAGLCAKTTALTTTTYYVCMKIPLQMRGFFLFFFFFLLGARL